MSPWLIHLSLNVQSRNSMPQLLGLGGYLGWVPGWVRAPFEVSPCSTAHHLIVAGRCFQAQVLKKNGMDRKHAAVGMWNWTKKMDLDMIGYGPWWNRKYSPLGRGKFRNHFTYRLASNLTYLDPFIQFFFIYLTTQNTDYSPSLDPAVSPLKLMPFVTFCKFSQVDPIVVSCWIFIPCFRFWFNSSQSHKDGVLRNEGVWPQQLLHEIDLSWCIEDEDGNWRQENWKTSRKW